MYSKIDFARTPEIDRPVLSLQFLRLAYRNNIANILVNVAAASGIMILFNATMHESLWLWYASVLLLSAGRIVTTLVFLKRQRNEHVPAPRPIWTALYAAGLLIAGLLWASLSLFQLPTWPPVQTYMVLVIISALAGGATGILAPMKTIGRIYIGLLIIPPSSALILSPAYPDTLGALGLLFLIVMLFTHRNNHQVLLRSMALQQQNTALVTTLKNENREIEGFNAKLEARVQERTAALEKMSRTDGLTGLANRSGLAVRFEAAGLHTANHCFDVVCLTLTSLSQIGDTLGDAYADAMLIALTGRLRERLPKEVIAARWTSEDFIFIVPVAGAGHQASYPITTIIREIMGEAINARGRDIYLTHAIGRATSTGDDGGISDAIRAAMLAAHSARSNGDDSVLDFTPQMKAEQERRLSIAQELKQALQRNEFELFFQPIVSAATGEVECQEVLLRWTNARLGAITPDEFIPRAEETGDIIAIGEWVLATACEMVASHAFFAPRITVNVSIKQFLSPGFPSRVLKCLDVSGMPVHRLVLEVTETCFDERTETMLNPVLSQLRAAGIEIHIDDFGTGYSSLSRISELQVDAIKIDKCFVQSDDARSLSIVEATLAIAKSHGLKTVAEGVEDKPTWDRLKTLGVDCLQGYHFGKPMPWPGPDASMKAYTI